MTRPFNVLIKEHMTAETVRYDKPIGKPSVVLDVLYVFSTLAVGGFCLLRGIWLGVLGAALFMGALYFGRLASVTNAWHRSYASARRHMVNAGYKIDFEHDPRLMVDTARRKIAVVTPADGVYDIMDFTDILEWEHLWINKETPRSTDSAQRLLGSQYTKENNRLVLKTRNPHVPRYEFPIGNYDTGQLWMARLSALLKG